MSRLIDCDSEEFVQMEECPSCLGSGSYDIGDPEDGVCGDCPECEGSGEVETGDTFVPERDAFKAGE